MSYNVPTSGQWITFPTKIEKGATITWQDEYIDHSAVYFVIKCFWGYLGEPPVPIENEPNKPVKGKPVFTMPPKTLVEPTVAAKGMEKKLIVRGNNTDTFNEAKVDSCLKAQQISSSQASTMTTSLEMVPWASTTSWSSPKVRYTEVLRQTYLTHSRFKMDHNAIEQRFPIRSEWDFQNHAPFHCLSPNQHSENFSSEPSGDTIYALS
jgi:hypothetical protein